jgi:protein-S-isoprenylcysteine O-methyltransferase Ste14
MRPLPFVWPYWLVFWAIFIWAFVPEFRIVRKAQTSATRPDSQDAGSVRVIMLGMWAATVIAFPLAWVTALRLPSVLASVAFFIGTATIVAGSLLRRHCWRLLGASFTGDVRARPEQAIVTTGAYAIVRHPSYSAGILMNAGIGLALGSWGSTVVLVLTSVAVYSYRIKVEERALLAVLGEPYREFKRTRPRLMPFFLLVGIVYLAVGIIFGALAGAATSDQMRGIWRLAAFVVSAVVFGAHIGYEHFRLGNTPRLTAFHAAAAVALGACALAAAANLHSLTVASGNQRLLLIALVAWPLLCALPAFGVAFAAAAGLRAMGRKASLGA